MREPANADELLRDMLDIERNGHGTLGYTCECGVRYSNRRPTADHIDHLRAALVPVEDKPR